MSAKFVFSLPKEWKQFSGKSNTRYRKNCTRAIRECKLQTSTKRRIIAGYFFLLNVSIVRLLLAAVNENTRIRQSAKKKCLFWVSNYADVSRDFGCEMAAKLNLRGIRAIREQIAFFFCPNRYEVSTINSDDN